MSMVVERMGSREFDAGAGGGSGQLLFTVLAATDEANAVELALAQSVVEPVINGYLLESWAVVDQGGQNYNVDIKYRRGVPSEAAPTAGQTPTESRPSPPGQNKDDPLTRDVSFTIGGETKRVYHNPTGITRHKIAATGDTAPDFGGLIGVKVEADGKTATVEGCEIFSASADFSITKRYSNLTLGWFRHNLDLVATTNSEPFLGCDVGECLYMGADGSYKDGDQGKDGTAFPWTATGKWKYSRNREDVVVGALTFPDIPGHSYVWIVYKRKGETVTINGASLEVLVEYPLWGYVEDVYEEEDHRSLGFN